MTDQATKTRAGQDQARLDAYIKRVVDDAPPLSDEQRDKLSALLRPGAHVPAPVAARVQTPKPTLVYRHYDAAGVLLYIGISHDPIVRAYSHSGSSWWSKWACRMETDRVQFPAGEEGRQAALAYEREVIQREGPVFNTVHAVDKHRTWVDYLVNAGAWEHLALKYGRHSPDLIQAMVDAGGHDGIEVVQKP